MIPTLSTATAGGGLALAEFVTLAADHGFSGVEFSINEAADLVKASSFADVAGIFESRKVLPITMHLPVEWRRDDAAFDAGMAELPALAKLAQDLDCSRCITYVHPDGGIPVEQYHQTSVRRWAQIARVLSDNGVRLGLEFLGPKHLREHPENVWFYDIPGALDVVAEVSERGGLENVGLLVDAWHWYTSGGTIMDLASIPLEQIVHVHINDAPDKPRDEQIDNERLLPGASGVIDMTGFLKTLGALGYDGPLSVETFSAELNAMPAAQAASLGSAAVAKVMAAAAIKPVVLL